jgi:NAD(P)-dependent dehydrogenase (short-subunit alcohol dehydrogenase family)
MILRDKVAIVTGSSKGIGRGIAQRFAREGARVVVNGRAAEAVEQTAGEIRDAGGVALAVSGDITKRVDVDRLYDETLRAYGTVDILVNNAQTPVNRGESGPFLTMSPDGWDAYIAANLGGLFYCTYRAVQIMAPRRSGSIVNISSNGAARAHRRSIAYDSVKGAMDSFTRAVAVDLAPWGIRVNGIRPGLIAVDNWEDLSEGEKNRRRQVIPLGREGYPADVAWAAVFFAADDGAYTTGQLFEVDGGLLVQGRAPIAELQPVATPENTPAEPSRGDPLLGTR